MTRGRASDVIKRWVRFALGTQAYALQIAEVHEVLASADIEPVPGAPPHVLGVINLRGHIVTVLDLRVCFGAAAVASHQGSVIIAGNGTRLVGFAVDGIADVVNIIDQTIQPPPQLGLTPATAAIRGLVKRKDEVLTLLEVGRLLPA